MSANHREWDVALTTAGAKNYPLFCVNLPAPLSRALREAGYTRATLTVTDVGIVIRPYAGERREDNQLAVAELPEAWSPA